MSVSLVDCRKSDSTLQIWLRIVGKTTLRGEVGVVGWESSGRGGVSMDV